MMVECSSVTSEVLSVSSVLDRHTDIYFSYRINIKYSLFRFNSLPRTWFGIVSFLKSLYLLFPLLVLRELKQM